MSLTGLDPECQSKFRDLNGCVTVNKDKKITKRKQCAQGPCFSKLHPRSRTSASLGKMSD